MTILSQIYASAPASEVLIPTIEIRHSSMPSVYICIGFENITATTEDDEDVTFIATEMGVPLTAKLRRLPGWLADDPVIKNIR